MGYGLTFDDVKNINHPAAAPAPWGSITRCTEAEQYSMHRIELNPGASRPLHFYPGGEGRLFVERGEFVVRTLDASGTETAVLVREGETFPVGKFLVHGYTSKAGAVAYLIGSYVGAMGEAVTAEPVERARATAAALQTSNLGPGGIPTSDVREKYWGRIETILDGDVAGKRILIKKDGQSSMEFHVHKHESYYIHSGLLKVGLRVGRAENRSIVMKAGESYDMHPGVMHMRMALEDTVIIEASTRDSDSDSYLVEDGQTYRFIESQ